MKVFLLQDVVSVGKAGSIINVSDGYAANFLFPRKLALEVTAHNEKGFLERQKMVEKREAVVASKKSELADRVKALKLVIASKAHAVEQAGAPAKLYGAINATEVVTALAAEGITVAKNQVEFEKAIKTTGSHSVIIKLSNKLQPKVTVKVVAQ